MQPLINSPCRLSVLDLSPVTEGATPREALANSLDLARHAEALGYHRYWLAEHHNMAGIASAATAVVIGHVAGGTRQIRVGAGGIMLPNHSPLVIAEQFGTLESLYPGRIDLGLGRAPGTDQITAHALRRTLSGDVDQFPQDVMELIRYFSDDPGRVQAVPGRGLHIPVWILGSSLFGASLAGALGLPFAFASHFAPAALHRALEVYRSRFQPSPMLERPYAMLGFNVCAADTEEEAVLLRSSALQSFVRLRTGNPGKLPPPIPGYLESLRADERYMVDQIGSCSAIGNAEQVAAGVREFVRTTGADELIVVSQIYSHAARRRSYEILADALRDAN
ncbi:MAG: LLM class flavin-dependent oxidoreductase [Pseudomonadales bacterium]